LTRDRFDARLVRTANDDSPEAAVSLVIDVDGTAAGSATLFDFDLLARHAEAGINLEQKARGRGIGTAAIIQLVEFGFVRHNLRRIHLQAISSNVAAIRAYGKAGFVIEGRQRQHAWVRGAYEDIVRMGILLGADLLGLIRFPLATPAHAAIRLDIATVQTLLLPPASPLCELRLHFVEERRLGTGVVIDVWFSFVGL
ncbi:MAG: GNAT family protein, partial [Marmoricola sp.]